MSAIPITVQIECVERELKYRKRVYDRRIINGDMTRELADREIERMKAVLETLQMVERTQRLL